MTLAQYDEIQARIQIAAKSHDAQELTGINDHLETLEHHARKVKDNTGRLRKIMELRIWNLYHLGQVLNEIAPHGGSRFRGVNLDVTLMQLGINKNLSARARQIASIHTEDIRTFIDESGDELNISHMLRLHTETVTDPPEWDEDAEWMAVLTVIRDYVDNGQDDDRVSMASDWLAEGLDEDY